MSKQAQWKLPPPDTQIDWREIVALPFEDYAKRVRDIKDLDPWIDRAVRFLIDPGDPNFQNPSFSTSLARLMQLLVSKCDFEANTMFTEKTRTEKKLVDASEKLQKTSTSLETLERERDNAQEAVKRLDEMADALEKARAKSSEEKRMHSSEVRQLKTDIDRLRAELKDANKERSRAENALEEARRNIRAKDQEVSRSETDQVQALEKHNQLARKWREANEQLEKYRKLYAEVDAKYSAQTESLEGTVRELKHQLVAMREENLEMAQAKDAAETLCARREQEALQHLEEMQRIHASIMAEEEERYEKLQNDFASLQAEASRNDARNASRMLNEKDAMINELRGELEKSRRGGSSPSFERGSSGASPNVVGGADPQMVRNLLSTQQRLQEKVEALTIELEQAEASMVTKEDEIHNLKEQLNYFGHGDEGRRRLHNELAEVQLENKILQDELHQMRERCANMEDTADLCHSLKILCRKLGVTEEELQALNERNTVTETETLRQEVYSLKEEIEWLEKDRRHWMRRVRQQPLLDTKLRLELGLTPAQLEQLDRLVDQMRSGALLVEDYSGRSEKDIREAQEHQQALNEELSRRIESAVARLISAHSVSAAGTTGSGGSITTGGGAEISSYRRFTNDELESVLQEIRKATSSMNVQETTSLKATINQLSENMTTQENSMKQLQVHIEAALREASQWEQRCGEQQVELKSITEERERLREALRRREDLGSSSTALNCDEFFEVESVLRDQLLAKGAVVETLTKKLTEAEKLSTEYRQKADSLSSRLQEKELTLKNLRSEQEDSQRLHEMINTDYEQMKKQFEDLRKDREEQASDTERKLLHKVIQLRQREGKLLQKMREMSRESEDRKTLVDSSYDRTEKSMKEIVELLRGETVPSSAMSRFMQEGEVSQALEGLNKAIEKVLNGQLLSRDGRYVSAAQRSHENFLKRCDYSQLQRENAILRAERDDFLTQRDTLSVELATVNKKLSLMSGTTSDSMSPAAVAEVELETLRQLNEKYVQRLADKDRELRSLESQLEDARCQLLLRASVTGDTAVKENSDLRPAESASGATGDKELEELRQSLAMLKRKCISQEEKLEQLQEMKDTSEHGLSESGASTKLKEQQKESRRMKETNIRLVQSLTDCQAEKRVLKLEIDFLNDKCSLLSKNHAKEDVIEKLVQALQDNTSLRTQTEMALSRSRNLAVKLRACEANHCLVLGEVNTYRRNSVMLYKTFFGRISAIIERLRSFQRAAESRLSVRQSQSIVGCNAALEESNQSLSRKLSETRARLSEMVSKYDAALGELRSTRDPSYDENSAMPEVRRKLMIKDRELVELSEEIRYLREKNVRQEEYNRSILSQLADLEAPHPSAIFDTHFLEQLEQLRQCFETSPASVKMSSVVLPKADNEEEIISEYHNVVQRQSQLTQQNAELQKQLSSTRLQVSKTDSQRSILQNELFAEQQKSEEAQRQLQDERQRTAERLESQRKAHEAQLDLEKRAWEHNAQVLRQIIAGKERSIAQMNDQIERERSHHLENSLREMARLEHLHEQLYGENKVMIERFQDAINEFSTSRSPNETETQASVQNMLTQELAHAHQQVKELQVKNISLERKVMELSTAPSTAPYYQTTPGLGSSQPAVSGTTTADPRVEALLQREQDLLRLLQDRSHAPPVQGGNAPSVNDRTGRPESPIRPSSGGASSRANAELNELRSNLEELRMREQAQQDRIKSLSAEKSRVERDYDTLLQRVREQQAQVSRSASVEADNAALQKDIAALQEQNNKLVNATRLLREKMLEQPEGGGSKDARDASAVAQVQKLAGLQQESSQKLQQMEHRLNTLREDHRKLLARDKILSANLDNAERAVSNLERALREKENVITSLRKEVEEKELKARKAIAEARRSAATTSGKVASEHGPKEQGNQNKPPTTATSETNGKPAGSEGPREDVPPVAQQPLSSSTVADESKPDPSKTEEKKTQGGEQQAPTSTDQGAGALQPKNSSPDDRKAAKKKVPAVQGQEIASAITTKLQAMRKEHEEQLREREAASRKLELTLTHKVEALERDKDSLSHQVAQLTKKLEEVRRTAEVERTKHKEEILNFLEERRRAASVAAKKSEKEVKPPSRPVDPPPSAPPQSSPPAESENVPPTHGPSAERGTEGSSAAATKNWVELQSASATLRLHDTIRRQRKEIEKLQKVQKNHEHCDTDKKRIQEELEERKKEILSLRTRLATMESSAPQQKMPLSEMKEHKREVLRLEETIEDLQRKLSVDAEAKQMSLRAEVEKLNAELQRMLAGGGAKLPEDSDRDDRAQQAEKLLKQESLILDLRFDRESLSMKVGRLQRHINDLMSCEAPSGGPSSQGGGVGGKEKEKMMPATTGVLEAVIDNMKTVIDKLQKENDQLKSSGVTSTRYVEALKDIKALKQREKELVEVIQQMSFKLSQAQAALRPGGKVAEQNASLQRRLRVAQTMADQYQTELQDLKVALSSRSEAPPKPAPSPLPVRTEHHFDAHHREVSPTGVPMPVYRADPSHSAYSTYTLSDHGGTQARPLS